jgi:hypothetical protein
MPWPFWAAPHSHQSREFEPGKDVVKPSNMQGDNTTSMSDPKRSQQRCAPISSPSPAAISAAFAATTRAAVGIIIELNR